jgi:hypothetical protein
MPVNLHRLRETYPKTCVIPMKVPGVTQIHCRAFVVEEAH